MDEVMVNPPEIFTEEITTLYERSGGVELDPHEKPSTECKMMLCKVSRKSYRQNQIVDIKTELDDASNTAYDIIMACVNNDANPRNLRYIVDVRQFAEAMPVKAIQNAYRTIRNGFQRLDGIVLVDDVKKDGIKITAAFTRWEKNGHTIIIDLTPHFKAAVLASRQTGMTIYEWKYSLALRGRYSKSLYYCLKKFERTGRRWFNLTDLRAILKFPDGRRNSDLIVVIRDALAEINEKTDIYAEFTTKTTPSERGKPTISQIIFSIKEAIPGKPVGELLDAPEEKAPADEASQLRQERTERQDEYEKLMRETFSMPDDFGEIE